MKRAKVSSLTPLRFQYISDLHLEMRKRIPRANVSSLTPHRFQYISDLHLEMRKIIPNIPVIAKDMILAGDIGNPFHNNYEQYLRMCSDKYENTYVVSGNHEYWNENGIDATDEKINDIASKLNNVYYMNNRKIETENFCILGCTLWSNLLNIPSEENIGKIGDDINIKNNGTIIGTSGLQELHDNDVLWLTKTLVSCEKPTVVITHHLPTFKLMHRKYAKSTYLDRYYTNLEHLIRFPISTLIGGHSHCSMKININDVFLAINAYGYPNQYEKFYSKHKISSFVV